MTKQEPRYYIEFNGKCLSSILGTMSKEYHLQDLKDKDLFNYSWDEAFEICRAVINEGAVIVTHDGSGYIGDIQKLECGPPKILSYAIGGYIQPDFFTQYKGLNISGAVFSNMGNALINLNDAFGRVVTTFNGTTWKIYK